MTEFPVSGNLLRPYKNHVVYIPVHHDWITEVEAFGHWLVQQEDDKNRNTSWARVRRMCLIAFQSYYNTPPLNLHLQFNSKHKKWAKFPSKFDYEIEGKKIKIVHFAANEKWNLGHMSGGRVTKKSFEKSGDIFILASYNVDRVLLLGWLNREQMSKHRNNDYFHIKEPDVNPMHELEILAKHDTRRWYV